jgi:NAD(P)-dependent dehydrogenase (short-subunit alcohol dehydrogenase family)
MGVNQLGKKTIILTGATRGIGRAILMKLWEQYHVIMIAQGKEELTKLKSEASFGNAEAYPLDLADKTAIKIFTDSIERPIYGIINNAGVCKTMLLSEYPEKADPWDIVLATNLHGPYHLVRGLVNKLEDGGRIVNIGSQLGHDGRAGYSAYCASKHALAGLTSTWAKELGGRGITVNSVNPSWVLTEMSKADIERMSREEGVSWDNMYSRLCAPLALKRFSTPEEVASLVCMLLSEGASGITGQNILMTEIIHPQ